MHKVCCLSRRKITDPENNVYSFSSIHSFTQSSFFYFFFLLSFFLPFFISPFFLPFFLSFFLSSSVSVLGA